MSSSHGASRPAVAVIGMAGRFPGANGVEALWRNLREGVESVARIPLEEWADEVATHPSLMDRPDVVPFRPQIEGVEMFDAGFFGFTPREAQILDPQQRLFLECAWETLENAGHDSERFPGSIGVAAGVSTSTYLMNRIQWDRELNALLGGLKIHLANMNDSLATRVAYKLNLRGPVYTVQSFCSTSLVAVHLACQSLLHHESDMMLAGGVTIVVPQNTGYQYQEGGILSPDGHTRTFDARAGGMVFGNGLGCVALRRLEDAVRDGDNIRAVILGSAVNNDGAVKVGFTAPSVNGQADVIVEALAAAGVDPTTLGYVEAHGTATALGDPAEIAGLTKAWRRWTDRRQFCAIGSVKTNVGHLDAAAGVTGLVKTVLCLEHGEIPRSLHFETPNPQIDFESSPFFVADRLRKWERTDARPRRAGLSSFGIGGTNAHAILEEAPPPPPPGPERPWQLLLLSARTEGAAARAAVNLSAHLGAHPEVSLADVAFTLQTGRRAFEHRRFAVARDVADAAGQLADPARLEGGVSDRQNAPVAFMFTGQGAQYAGMGRGLYEEEPAFAEALDACAEALRDPLGLDLRDVLFVRGRSADEADEELRQTRLTQPALFAVEYALARLWESLGVRPAALVGHSVGEYVAACLAGVFRLEDALRLVAERGRLMQELPPGGMLAVPLGEEALRPLLGPDLDLASLNTPSASVVSGPHDAVNRLQRELRERGVEGRTLHTSHAFHSAMMDPILPVFAERLAAVERRPPQLPFVSNVTGTWITAAEATDPAYWARHLRAPVRFADGVRCLHDEGRPVLLEVGPGRTLASLARQAGGEGGPPTTVTTLRHPHDATADRAHLLGTLGRLWRAGAGIDWARAHGGPARRRVVLPSYPFERERHWVERNEEARQASDLARGFSLQRQEVRDWFYQPSWRRFQPGDLAAGPAFPAPGSSWLVFIEEDGEGFGRNVARRLRDAGQTVATVEPGPAFSRRGDGEYVVHPGRRTDYEALLAALGPPPAFVVHCWLAAPPRPGPLDARVDEAQERGFLSVLQLVQSLARAGTIGPLQLAVVTAGMQDVVGGDLTAPEKGTVLGPCRVVPQEFPNVVCRAVDLEPASGEGGDTGGVDHLLAEMTRSPVDTVVAYRGGHRWVQTVEPTPLEPANGRLLPLRRGGTYLITGGLGGIGLALARHLAERWGARLVLTGRSPLPAREEWPTLLVSGDGATRDRIRQVQELEATGAEVLYAAADVARREDMAAVVDAARRRFGRIDGAVHAAGVPGGGIIPLKEPAEVARVMRPKLQGTLALDEVLADEGLDFLLLCSSTAALIGGLGQVDYCGANAFLDAWARRADRRAERPVLSVNWDAWREVGMAVHTPVSGPLRAIRDLNLKLGISSAEGCDAFERVLAAGLPQVAVFTMDLRPALARQSFMRGGAALASPLVPTPEGASPAEEEKAAVADGLGGEMERLVAESWSKVLGRARIGADDNFFELGGDSLTALQVTSLLKTKLGREIPIVTFYDAPTVGLLARALAPEGAGESVALDEVGSRAHARRERMQRRRRPRALDTEQVDRS